VARAHRELQGHQVQEDFLGLQDPKVWMVIQEKEDLGDLLDVQEVQGSLEDQAVKELLVIKELKGSQVCQVMTSIYVMQFVCLKNLVMFVACDCENHVSSLYCTDLFYTVSMSYIILLV
jgi:hypothetical protein